MKIIIFDESTHVVAKQNIRSGGRPKLFGIGEIFEYSCLPYNITKENSDRNRKWKLMVKRLKRRYKLK